MAPAPPPHSKLSTHTVTNQVPAWSDLDLLMRDPPLRDALARWGTESGTTDVQAFGLAIGTHASRVAAREAHDHPPRLHTHDPMGHRIDALAFHPSWHRFYGLARQHGLHSRPWEGERAGHMHHAAMEYLLTQVEPGVCCPLTMTYAGAPVLQKHAVSEADWFRGLIHRGYEPELCRPSEKAALSLGMAMTEKQGGSDVRANTTRAIPDDPSRTDEGAWFRLTGHKWFCSAPQSDGVLTLAYRDEGLTCFLVPRVLDGGERNVFRIQRLKDKLGNRSNASSEIEYDGTLAQQIGETGRGIRTILEMVHHTRLDCTVAATGLMRAAVDRALHHARHRHAFGARLVEQPLMKNVLADLCLEAEASMWLAFRMAHAYDASAHSAEEQLFSRLGVAITKYWTNKRCVPLVGEAMECLGGAGYVEDHGMALLFREAPLNGIWEGSGNVICLDVLRTLHRTPEAGTVLLDMLEAHRGADPRLDTAISRAQRELARPPGPLHARRLVEHLALTLAATLLIAHAPSHVADAWIRTRLGRDWGQAFGTLPEDLTVDLILERAGGSV